MYFFLTLQLFVFVLHWLFDGCHSSFYIVNVLTLKCFVVIRLCKKKKKKNISTRANHHNEHFFFSTTVEMKMAVCPTWDANLFLSSSDIIFDLTHIEPIPVCTALTVSRFYFGIIIYGKFSFHHFCGFISFMVDIVFSGMTSHFHFGFRLVFLHLNMHDGFLS